MSICPEQPSGESSMPYQMLGDDALSEEQRIEKYTGEVDWSYLAPHLRAGVLYHLDPSIELSEAAQHFVKDDSDAVQALMKKGDLTKMDHLHAEWFEKNPQHFTAVVVSPFVLCQPVK